MWVWSEVEVAEERWAASGNVGGIVEEVGGWEDKMSAGKRACLLILCSCLLREKQVPSIWNCRLHSFCGPQLSVGPVRALSV